MIGSADLQKLQKDGFCVVKGALRPEQVGRAREALDRGADQMRQLTGSTHIEWLDPNASNVRVPNLPGVDRIFIDMLMDDDALAATRSLLGEHFIISNFSANNALPGSLPMRIHSDQALGVPAPWLAPWAVNVIWCLDDVDQENGSTLYLPDSHEYQSFEDVPADAEQRMVSFEAPAGSFIVMDGRLWHSSGSNISADRQRRMCFAYYCCDFVRPQMNWTYSISPELVDMMDERTKWMFGLNVAGNARLGMEYTRLQPA